MRRASVVRVMSFIAIASFGAPENIRSCRKMSSALYPAHEENAIARDPGSHRRRGGAVGPGARRRAHAEHGVRMEARTGRAGAARRVFERHPAHAAAAGPISVL